MISLEIMVDLLPNRSTVRPILTFCTNLDAWHERGATNLGSTVNNEWSWLLWRAKKNIYSILLVNPASQIQYRKIEKNTHTHARDQPTLIDLERLIGQWNLKQAKSTTFQSIKVIVYSNALDHWKWEDGERKNWYLLCGYVCVCVCTRWCGLGVCLILANAYNLIK